MSYPSYQRLLRLLYEVHSPSLNSVNLLENIVLRTKPKTESLLLQSITEVAALGNAGQAPQDISRMIRNVQALRLSLMRNLHTLVFDSYSPLIPMEDYCDLRQNLTHLLCQLASLEQEKGWDEGRQRMYEEIRQRYLKVLVVSRYSLTLRHVA